MYTEVYQKYKWVGAYSVRCRKTMDHEREFRYAVHKVVNGEIENTHKCWTWDEAQRWEDAISLVKGKAVVENINRE